MKQTFYRFRKICTSMGQFIDHTRVLVVGHNVAIMYGTNMRFMYMFETHNSYKTCAEMAFGKIIQIFLFITITLQVCHKFVTSASQMINSFKLNFLFLLFNQR